MGDLLTRIEWEVLQDELVIKTIAEPPFMKDAVESVTLRRDENHKITAVVSGRYGTAIDIPEPPGLPGSTAEPFQIIGSDRYGSDAYKVDGCYVLDTNDRMTLNADDKYVIRSFVRVLCQHVALDLKTTDKRVWLTDWYLNAPNAHDYACWPTKRDNTVRYARRRHGDSDEIGTFPGIENQSNTVDHLIVEDGQRKCIVHAVPQEIGPRWTKCLGIEYRNEFGWFPGEIEREAVAELVGFVFGRHLLNVGSTEYNEAGYPIRASAITPWGNARSQSQQSSWPPLRLQAYGENSAELVLCGLLSKYLSVRSQFGLKEALWRYWIANTLPIGTSVPLLANAVEIIAQAWFATNNSATKGVYMERSEWEGVVGGQLGGIEKSLKDAKYSNRLLAKIKSAYQMGANERLEQFFEEIELNVGKPEMDAIKARNKMIHSSIGVSKDEIDSAIRHTHAYRTLFHRVFLRMLEFDGVYTDYSSSGWVERPLDHPTDTVPLSK